MNKIILTGNITKDPDVMGNGEKKVVKATIAVRRPYVKENSDVTADFIPLTFFDRTADFAERYLKKGSRIEVSGRIENNNYTNKEGQKVYGFQFIVENVEFGGGKKDESEHSEFNPEPKPESKPEIPDMDDEDDEEELPFH